MYFKPDKCQTQNLVSQDSVILKYFYQLRFVDSIFEYILDYEYKKEIKVSMAWYCSLHYFKDTFFCEGLLVYIKFVIFIIPSIVFILLGRSYSGSMKIKLVYYYWYGLILKLWLKMLQESRIGLIETELHACKTYNKLSDPDYNFLKI